MTNSQRVLDLVRRRPGLTDSEIRLQTGIEPHQQVNQICRRLHIEGLLIRDREADGLIHNYAMGTAGRTEVASTTTSAPRVQSPASALGTIPPGSAAVIVLPCSGKKRGGGTAIAGPSILEILPGSLADDLRSARRGLAQVARLDESRLLRARDRYAGTLYAQAGNALGSEGVRPSPVVIISGGYGLVTADERIGTYDRRFSLADWPRGLLEACLLAYVEACGVRHVISFCSRTTDYATLIRRTSWRRNGIDALLASPDLGHRGGAQILVPRAAGQALVAFLAERLDPGWRSSDGLALRFETVS